MIATANPTIPAAIADLSRWVVWRYDAIGGGKTTKVPYQAKQPSARAKSNDPQTWASLADARRAADAGGFEGVGVMLGDLDDGRRLAGVDLDDCIVGGVVSDTAQAIVDAMPSYWEVSPSGQGLKALCYGRKPEGAKCRDGKVEVYDGGRWFAVTGQRFAGDAVVAAQGALAKVCGMAGLLRPETPQPAPAALVYTPTAQHTDTIKARASAYLAKMAQHSSVPGLMPRNFAASTRFRSSVWVFMFSSVEDHTL